MRKLAALIVAVSLAACSRELTDSSPSASPAQTQSINHGGLRGTYVLTAFGAQTNAPFVMFDAVCPTARYETLMLGDTVSLNADGSFHRGFALVQVVGRAEGTPEYTGWSGQWQLNPDGTVSSIGKLNGRDVTASLRFESAESLTASDVYNDACNSDPNAAPVPGQQVVTRYTRIR